MMFKGFLACLCGLVWVAGCALKAPPTRPPVVVVPPQVSPLEGVWENNVRGENKGRMLFNHNGELVFQGGMEFYNPGRWDWDPMRKQLVITLPQAPDNKLDIFKMYVGQGVQSFDRKGKRITYHFDDQTSTLNVGGWDYSKVNTAKPEIPAEPTLR